MTQQQNEQVERTITNEVLDNNLVFTLRETDEFCLYNGGCFDRGKEPKTALREYIDKIAERTLVPIGAKQTLKPYNLTNSKKETILEMLKSNSFISLKDFDREFDIICCENGLFKLSGFENCLLPNPNRKDGSYRSGGDPDKLVFGIKYFLTYEAYNKKFGEPYKAFIQIPVIYAPNAECLEIDQFLTDVFGFETVPLIYEFLAYVLMPTVKYQKAFLLYGPPSTGKTTFIDMIYEFYNGSRFFSDVRLQDLGEQFQTINLMHKLLNVFDDLPAKKMGDSYMFRQVVTNKFLRSEVKFVAEYVKWINRIKLLFSCNELAEVRKNEGDQFFRRWILIQCFNTFKDKDLMTQEDYDDPTIREKDYDMLERLCVPSEFSGLLNKILQAWIRLETRGYFPKQWNNPEYIKGLWLMDINPIKLFIDECCIVGIIEENDYNTFYTILNKFREDHNAKPISKHLCTQWLQRIDGIEKKRKSGGAYYYNGISIKDSILEKYGKPIEKQENKGIEEFTEEQLEYLENDKKKYDNEDYSDPNRF